MFEGAEPTKENSTPSFNRNFRMFSPSPALISLSWASLERVQVARGPRTGGLFVGLVKRVKERQSLPLLVSPPCRMKCSRLSLSDHTVRPD